MSWANLDDGFADHPKVIDLPDAAFRLHVCSMCWCSRRLTDGLVRSRELRILGAMLEGYPDDRRLQDLAQKLVDARLWDHCEEGWRLHDWLKHNESAQKVIERREASRQRMAASRKGKGSDKRTFAETSRERSAERASERSSEVRVPSPLLSSPLPIQDPKALSNESEGAPAQQAPSPVGLSGHAEPEATKPASAARNAQEAQQGALIPLCSPDTRKPAKPRKTAPQSIVSEIWAAYSAAFAKRYQAQPTNNAKVFGQVNQFAHRIPQADAPAVAAFYVSHPSAYYTNRMHPVGMLLADAEKLHAEWKRGQPVTRADAQQAERTYDNPGLRWLRRNQQQASVIDINVNEEEKRQ